MAFAYILFCCLIMLYDKYKSDQGIPTKTYLFFNVIIMPVQINFLWWNILVYLKVPISHLTFILSYSINILSAIENLKTILVKNVIFFFFSLYSRTF